MFKHTPTQDRFAIKKQLGQGSFSTNFLHSRNGSSGAEPANLSIGTIYSAQDNHRNEMVALKIEKADKSKKVLIFEYQVLKNLQGIALPCSASLDLPNICKIYDFIESGQPNGLNFIVMQMLGKVHETERYRQEPGHNQKAEGQRLLVCYSYQTASNEAHKILAANAGCNRETS